VLLGPDHYRLQRSTPTGAVLCCSSPSDAPVMLWLVVCVVCRHMHESNQPPLMHPLISAFQWLLLSTPVGRWLVQVRAHSTIEGVGGGVWLRMGCQ